MLTLNLELNEGDSCGCNDLYEKDGYKCTQEECGPGLQCTFDGDGYGYCTSGKTKVVSNSRLGIFDNDNLDENNVEYLLIEFIFYFRWLYQL